ncbi:hypothetical protein QG516_03300 [Pedobacter gandavensis]|uniref:hypothetical protein n=1 Tax=Pedobacter gandavensis TaxID=2679963 RepID=UPI0024797C85|nr:hypothetical protein [Pedobacter gandavensis]WGQ10680.1 hypothetical protein QG516_03300 [Pedobacter gandavensis]
MKNQETIISSDLQLFINSFQPNKFKLLAHGIEVRGINNMHSTITQARNLIERLGLKLTIQHDAEMLSYGGFEVNNSK